MTRKEVLPAVIVLRPNAGGLWLTYLIWLPTLTLCCVGFGINLLSEGSFDTERIVALIFGVGLLIGWFLLVRKTLRTISAFRFNVAARSMTITYPSTKHEFFKADEIALCSTLQGSPRRPHYDGPKDRVLRMTSGREFHFPDLHVTRIKPEGFDQLMEEWRVSVQQVRVEATPDQSAHFTTSAEGLGVYLYRPDWGMILIYLALGCAVTWMGIFGALIAFTLPDGKSWVGLLFSVLFVMGGFVIAAPTFRYPMRAVLGTSHIDLHYLLQPKRRLAWTELSGFARGKVMVGKSSVLQPAVHLFLKDGRTVKVPSTMLHGFEHAPFQNFALMEQEAPRPFYL